MANNWMEQHPQQFPPGQPQPGIDPNQPQPQPQPQPVIDPNQPQGQPVIDPNQPQGQPVIDPNQPQGQQPTPFPPPIQQQQPQPQPQVINFQQPPQVVNFQQQPQFNGQDPNQIPQDTILQEHWLKAFWRPACAWVYLIICFMDFVGFPIIAMIQPIVSKYFGFQVPYTPWQPLTLQNGGFVHMSFAAILGVSAWTRGMRGNP